MIIRHMEDKVDNGFTITGPMASAVGERVYEIYPDLYELYHRDLTVQHFILNPLITNGEKSEIFTKVKGYITDMKYPYIVIAKGPWIEGKNIEPQIREIINTNDASQLLTAKNTFYNYLIDTTKENHTFYEKLAYEYNITICANDSYYICGYPQDVSELYGCNDYILDKLSKRTILVKKIDKKLPCYGYESITIPYQDYPIDQIDRAADLLECDYNDILQNN